MKLKQRAVALSAFLVLVVVSSVFLRIHLRYKSPQQFSVSTSSSVPSPSRSQPVVLSSPLPVKKISSSPVVTGSLKETWWLWQSWVREDTFYPEEVFPSGQMLHLLRVMASAAITEFGVGRKGTQLKASVVLEGQQKALFKPKRCGTYQYTGRLARLRFHSADAIKTSI